MDPACLYEKRINYIFTIPTLVELAIKGGRHHFHQRIIFNQKGLYLHFRAKYLYKNQMIYKSRASYILFRIEHRDIVEKYIKNLQELYTEQKILERAIQIALKIR